VRAIARTLCLNCSCSLLDPNPNERMVHGMVAAKSSMMVPNGKAGRHDSNGTIMIVVNAAPIPNIVVPWCWCFWNKSCFNTDSIQGTSCDMDQHAATAVHESPVFLRSKLALWSSRGESVVHAACWCCFFQHRSKLRWCLDNATKCIVELSLWFIHRTFSNTLSFSREGSAQTTSVLEMMVGTFFFPF